MDMDETLIGEVDVSDPAPWHSQAVFQTCMGLSAALHGERQKSGNFLQASASVASGKFRTRKPDC